MFPPARSPRPLRVTYPWQRLLLMQGTLRLQGRVAGAVGEEGAACGDGEMGVSIWPGITTKPRAHGRPTVWLMQCWGASAPWHAALQHPATLAPSTPAP